MNKELKENESYIRNELMKQVMSDLQVLELDYVDVNGIKLRPSQCYYVSNDPFHILYNTNCPDNLKQKIEGILSKWKLKG